MAPCAPLLLGADRRLPVTHWLPSCPQHAAFFSVPEAWGHFGVSGCGVRGSPRWPELETLSRDPALPPPTGRQNTSSFLGLKKFVDICEALELARGVTVLPKDGNTWPCGQHGSCPLPVPLERWEGDSALCDLKPRPSVLPCPHLLLLYPHGGLSPSWAHSGAGSWHPGCPCSVRGRRTRGCGAFPSAAW